MESLRFAEILSDSFYGLDETFVQHLSMYLNASQREGFLDFIGVEY